MNIKARSAILTFAMLFGGCSSANESYATADTEKGKTDMTQIIQLSSAKVAKITKDGEIWIGGEKAGTITSDGEIWVGGDKEGDLTQDGEVWKAGDKIGDITSKGEVWRDGNEVGTVEKDGTIWIGSSREGTFKGGNPRQAAAIVFYGFFKLGE